MQCAEISFSLAETEIHSIASVGKVTPASSVRVPASNMCVKLTLNSVNWVAIATDRYVVAEVGSMMHFPTWAGDLERIDVILEAATWAKIVKRFTAAAPKETPVQFTVSHVEGEATQVLVARGDDTETYPIRQHSMNFPPLEKLLIKDSWEGQREDIHVDFDALTKAAKATVPSQFHFAPKNRTNKMKVTFSSKDPGMIYMARPGDVAGETFRAVIMEFKPADR